MKKRVHSALMVEILKTTSENEMWAFRYSFM